MKLCNAVGVLLASVCLIAGCAPTATAVSNPSAGAGPAAPTANAPGEDQSSRVRGQAFSWTLAGRAAQAQECHEEWSFGEDNIMTVLSGEERVTERFALRSVAGEPMLELTQTRLTTNGRPDCQGGANAATGQTNRVYLLFLNGGGFFTCASTDTMSCYGVATPRR